LLEVFVTVTKLLLLPLLLHVLLTVFVGVRSLQARIKAVRRGQTKLDDIANDTNAWPNRVKKLGNNFDNQFETPMFWYSVCILVVVLKLEDYVFVGLSWIFLLARIGHSHVQTNDNDVLLRMRLFLFGFASVVVMWLWFGFQLLVKV
jgi:hypothetical protein